MKNLVVSLVFFLASITVLNAQVAISTDNSAPDNSAMLDIKSTTKGMLIPRMTFAERDAISSPANGLLVFCFDNNQYYTNKGTSALPNWVMVSSQWQNSGNNIYFGSGNVGIGLTTPASLRLQVDGIIGASYGSSSTPSFTFGNGDENTGFSSPITYSISFITQSTEKMRLNQAGALGIGTGSPNATALVDISSTTKGFLPPRMTYAQRNAIVNPAEGLMVFCTNCRADGTGCISLYFGGQWLNLAGNCEIPATPLEGSHVQSNTQIIWNWNTMPIANGYKWHTINNIASATDMGSATTKTETGLTQGNSYTRYVWAFNACGYSEPVVLTGQALPCGSSFTKTHTAGLVAPVTKTITYGTVTNIPGETAKCWITRNLGATQQPNTVNDDTEASAGWYWQFNRKQGYKHDGTTRTPNTTWITSVSENSDWESANDPCSLLLGSAWRLPTDTEWTNVDVAGNWTNWTGPFSSGLQMHAGGYIDGVVGLLLSRGTNGFSWSGTQSSTVNGLYLSFFSSSSNIFTGLKADGYTIRCLRD